MEERARQRDGGPETECTRPSSGCQICFTAKHGIPPFTYSFGKREGGLPRAPTGSGVLSDVTSRQVKFHDTCMQSHFEGDIASRLGNKTLRFDQVQG
jgi:hypothetical protein